MSQQEIVRRKRQDTLTQQASEAAALRRAPDATEQGANVAPPIVDEVLQSSGQPLDDQTRAFMEPRFGHDFGQVRVHKDERAAESASAVQALAYTVGQDVVFGTGQYAPGTSEGQRLIAHELTHVVQQDALSMQDPLPVNQNGDSHEREAEVFSNAIARSISPGNRNVSDASHLGAKSGRVPTTSALVQRQTQTATTSERIAELEHRLDVETKKTEATRIDLLWKSKFAAQFASYRQAVLLITGAMNTATKSFSKAQTEQAKTDALAKEILMSAGELILTPAFKWVLKEGTELSKEVIDELEKPTTSGVKIAIKAAEEGPGGSGQTPTLTEIPGAVTPGGTAGSDPMAFLTGCLRGVESQAQQIENEFIARLESMKTWPDDQWLGFDPAAREAEYDTLLKGLDTKASGVEKLRPESEAAAILERHLWAHWIANQADALRAEQEKENKRLEAEQAREREDNLGFEYYSGMSPGDLNQAEQNYSLGSDIEDRLKSEELHVDTRAQVAFSGHWYWPNKPDNWRELLLKWAREYSEPISK